MLDYLLFPEHILVPCFFEIDNLMPLLTVVFNFNIFQDYKTELVFDAVSCVF